MKTAAEVWFAPGRANLMGEHTDYNEGLVLPFALARGVTAAAAAWGDGLLVLRSKQVPDETVTVPLDSLAPGSVRGWAAYPAGVAWSLRAAGYPVRGASVDVDSDLPVGAGVSSSAALECSAALALCSLSGLTVPSVGVLLDRPMVTSPLGAALSATVNVSRAPDSLVTRPDVGITMTPAVSLSMFVSLTSAASTPSKVLSSLFAGAVMISYG